MGGYALKVNATAVDAANKKAAADATEKAAVATAVNQANADAAAK